MSNTLVLKSSILGDYSQSNQIIEQAIEGKSNVTIRDLAAEPVPVLDMAVATALRSTGDDLSDELKAIVKLSDELIAELQNAEKVVIAAPMYNFMIPTQLKNYFDLIARAGVTFKYTETGPVGLIKDKKVVVVTTRGGIHKDTPRDSMHDYLATILGFLGMTDVEFVYAEALNMGDEPAAENRASALEALAPLV
ncbi:FMN-dependent NADH-azoreductase [Vibrio sp. SCSIO 43140]|uniref:FMN dependent NADH:quinone oxidoreductase n=1 Tax=Vibrio maritimus TaxID=990268 RepID=A0A090RQW4_9VIBR|nr:FMN-dependent NADH-azoreductase [Vibrio sp. SCSIO 43140]USD62751.1 FMN-dependent NADH-azoreductase [Vibrio sp. SCSIO 43140]GAL16928.1 FMN-dependent NADH-azoreductase [Vibrio maritimus]